MHVVFVNRKRTSRLWWISILAATIVFFLIAESKVRADDLARSISFSWEPIAGATVYELEFSRKDGEAYTPLKPNRETEEANWTGELPPGTYRFRLRAKDTRGVPGPWGEPTDLPIKQFAVEPTYPGEGQEILTKQDETFKLKLTWKKMSNVKSYKIDIRNAAGEAVKALESTIASATVDLPVAAAYKYSIQTVSNAGETGDNMKAPVSFTLVGKALLKPVAKLKDQDIEDEASWSKPDFSESFKLSVSFAKVIEPVGKKKKKKKIKKADLDWQSVLENEKYQETSFSLQGRPYGFYQIKVIAQGKLRPSSKPLIMEFEYKDPKVKLAELPPAQRLPGAVIYSYLPAVEILKLDSGAIQTRLSILMLSSNRIAAAYWFLGHSIGLEGGVHRIYSELFGSKSRVSGPDGQKTLELSYWNVDLLARYQLDFPFFGLEVVTGAARKTLYSFAQTPTNTVRSERSSIVEILYGGRLFLHLGGTTTGLQLVLGSVLSSDHFKMTESKHSEFGLDFSHNIFSERFLMTYGLGSEKSEYVFTTPTQAGPQTITSTLGKGQISLTWRY